MSSKICRGTVLLGLGLSLVLAGGCNDVSTDLKAPTYSTSIKQDATRISDFQKDFPLQYASYMKNNESQVMTEYKGSVNFRKNDNVNPLPKGWKHAQPYLKNLWLGYPFMYEYNEARGHTYAIKDFLEIDRINRYAEKGGLPATCWNCKTPKMMNWIAEYGDKFWSKDVNVFRTKDAIDEKDETIGCANCHDPKTMELRLYSEPLKDWLKRSGRDWNKISRNEKRSLVCAQCHVEYYFTHKDNGPASRPVFPWDNGFGPEDMYQYYKDHGAKDANGKETPFFDWVHAASGVKMIKMQHPDYETFVDGPHGAAGVSCADCHMPYQRVDGKKVSSHWMTSPLKDPELRACRQCHADKTADFLRERVLYIQKRSFAQLLKAQEASVRAHEAVRLANEYIASNPAALNANHVELMNQAREMVRKGQLFWDYVSAENSVGFHNPTKTLDTLMSSAQFSMQAVALAEQATNYAISPALAGDIKTIVPPILEHSRKLQQDPAHLQSNPWLKLLPVLPPAEQVWKDQEKVAAK